MIEPAQKPSARGGGVTQEQHEFIVVETQIGVGTILACCGGTAEQMKRITYPNGQLGILFKDSDTRCCKEAMAALYETHERCLHCRNGWVRKEGL